MIESNASPNSLVQRDTISIQVMDLLSISKTVEHQQLSPMLENIEIIRPGTKIFKAIKAKMASKSKNNTLKIHMNPAFYTDIFLMPTDGKGQIPCIGPYTDRNETNDIQNYKLAIPCINQNHPIGAHSAGYYTNLSKPNYHSLNKRRTPNITELLLKTKYDKAHKVSFENPREMNNENITRNECKSLLLAMSPRKNPESSSLPNTQSKPVSQTRNKLGSFVPLMIVSDMPDYIAIDKNASILTDVDGQKLATYDALTNLIRMSTTMTGTYQPDSLTKDPPIHQAFYESGLIPILVQMLKRYNLWADSLAQLCILINYTILNSCTFFLLMF
jgi:hypothetical protein